MSTFPRNTLGLALALILASAATAQELRLSHIDGSSTTLALEHLTETSVVGLGPADARIEVALDRVATIVGFPNSTASPATALPHELWLRSGSQFRCQVVEPASKLEHGIPIQLGAGTEEQDIPLRLLRALRLGITHPDASRFFAALESPHRSDDLLFAIRPDDGELSRISIHMLGIDSELGLQVEYSGSLQSIPLERVFGIVFAEEKGAPPAPYPLPRLRITTQDGREFEGRLNGGPQVATFRFGPDAVAIPMQLDQIERIQVLSNLVSYLSDREPVVSQVPALDRIRPWLRDASPQGQGLRVGGKTFDRGLCLIPRTEMRFALDGSFDRFEATLGIDDRAGPMGHAVVRILADDREVWSMEALTPDTPPQELSIELGAAQSLTLMADFAVNLDLGDHVAFANARLIKNR